MATRDEPDKRLTPLETLIMNVLWDESPVSRQAGAGAANSRQADGLQYRADHNAHPAR